MYIINTKLATYRCQRHYHVIINPFYLNALVWTYCYQFSLFTLSLLLFKIQGSPQKKKSSGRSHKNLNLAREQRNNMFTVASARAKKSKDFFIKTQQSIVVSRPITHSPTRWHSGEWQRVVVTGNAKECWPVNAVITFSSIASSASVAPMPAQRC